MHVIQYPPLLAPPTGVPRSTPSLPLGPYTLGYSRGAGAPRNTLTKTAHLKAYYKRNPLLGVLPSLASTILLESPNNPLGYRSIPVRYIPWSVKGASIQYERGTSTTDWEGSGYEWGGYSYRRLLTPTQHSPIPRVWFPVPPIGPYGQSPTGTFPRGTAPLVLVVSYGGAPGGA